MPVAHKAVKGPNTIRILLSSDNHVGYNERDPIRGDDSLKTFKEIMTIAKDRDVDMVLLAGDLFHENKPSHKAVYHVEESLRKMCYDHKPCELELLSDANIVLQDSFGHINYEDEHINVATPVLAISGNHDDATGDAHLSALDTIAVTGLINHIGKVPENDNIRLNPLLFRKGYTKLALYAMANVRDERLHRTFRDKKVKFIRPSDNEDDQTPYFNLMALHQNHHSHTETGYLPENFLPNFLDLVIWGHEHECLMDPSENPETGFHVIQPGSSVVTSLCEGEAVEKHVAILSITGVDFHVEKIRLKTVRPFVMKEVILSRDCGFTASSNNQSQVLAWLIEQVELLIKEANQQWKQANSDEHGVLLTTESPPLPLIRLRVEYSGGYEMENPRRFSNRFVGRVANVNDVVQFYRKKKAVTSNTRKSQVGEIEVPDVVELDQLKVQSLVEEYLTHKTMSVLPSAGLIEAVGQFVDKDDKQAIKAFAEDTLVRQLDRLLALGEVDEDTLDLALSTAANELPAATGPRKRRQYEESTKRAAVKVTKGGRPSRAAAAKKRLNDPELDFESDESDEFEKTPAPTALRSRGQPGRRLASKPQLSDRSASSDEEGTFAKPTPASSRTAAKSTSRARKAPTKTSAQRNAPPLFHDSEDDVAEDEVEDEILEDSSDVEMNAATKAKSRAAAPKPSKARAPRNPAATNMTRKPAAQSQLNNARAKPIQSTLNLGGGTTNKRSTSNLRTAPAPIEIVDDDDYFI